jgi:hypothetical protein
MWKKSDLISIVARERDADPAVCSRTGTERGHVRRRIVEIDTGSAKPPSEAAELDLEALSAAERTTTDPRTLVSLLLAHAERIADSKRADAAELALRKATRAHLAAKELGDRDLVLEALRARVAFAKRAPGRHELAAELARELIALLDASPGDTRRERALLLAEAWSKPWWWYSETRAPERAEIAGDVANLQEALSLLRDVGDDVADDIAFVAGHLLQLLERCHAIEAATELRAALRGTSPVVREACARRGLDS